MRIEPLVVAVPGPIAGAGLPALVGMLVLGSTVGGDL